MKDTNILDLILCNITTQSHYNQYLTGAYHSIIMDNMYLVYYVLNLPDDTEPIKPLEDIDISYITNEHFAELGLTDNELLNTAISNTATLFPAQVHTITQYLQNFIDYHHNDEPDWITGLKISMVHIVMERMKDVPEHDALFVLTNEFYYRGAVSVLFKNTLKNFCLEKKFSTLLIQPSNPDYAFIACGDIPENRERLMRFLKSTPSLYIPGDITPLLEENVYLYDVSTNTMNLVTK